MLITVIVPVYNVKPYLVEALDSVINQTYRDLEIIVVDDGSTDGSGGICDEYAAMDPRVKVMHQENKGLAAARNVGLDMMQGEAVCFLDSDDAFLPGFVERMLAAIEKSGADISVCRHAFCQTVGKMDLTGKEYIGGVVEPGIYSHINALRGLVNGALHMFACVKLYRRDLWNGLRFPVGRTHEDMDTAYYVINRCQKLYILGEVLYKYRQRPDSITHTLSIKHVADYFTAGVKIDAFVKAHEKEIFADSPSAKYQTMIEKMVMSFVNIFTTRALAGKYKIKIDGGGNVDVENLQWVMSTEQGRQFVSEILSLCGAGAMGGTGVGTKDFYLIGRRSVGEDLLHFIRSIEAGGGSSDGLALEYMMLREHKQRQEENENG